MRLTIAVNAETSVMMNANWTNLRSSGSGNPGGLNAARVLGKKWGLLVIVLDAAKGSLAGFAGLAIGDAAAYAAIRARRVAAVGGPAATINIGPFTLPPGKSTTIMFSVTVNALGTLLIIASVTILFCANLLLRQR